MDAENLIPEEKDDLQTEQEQRPTESFTEAFDSFVNDLHPEFEQKTPQEEETPSEEEPVKKEVPKEDVVSDAWIEKYPPLKTLKGKPIEEVAKSYVELERAYSKSQNELHKLRKEAEKAEQKPATEFTDEEVKDLLDLEPAAQREYLDKLISKRVMEGIKDIQAKLEPYEIEVKKKQTEDMKAQIQESLPEGMTVDEVLSAFREANKDILLTEDGELNAEIIQFYEKHPRKFYSDVLSFAKTKHLEELSKKNIGEVKKKVYEETKRAAIKSQDKLPPVSTRRNDETPELDRVDEALLSIQQNARAKLM